VLSALDCANQKPNSDGPIRPDGTAALAGFKAGVVAWSQELAMNQLPHSSNRILASLDAEDFRTIQARLTKVELAPETVLFDAGDIVQRVYFPHAGVISLVVPLESGEMIHAASVGHESVVGAFALTSDISLSRAIVQIAGAASTLDVQRLRELAEKSVRFRARIQRHQQMLFVQAQQSAACNAAHTAKQRMCGWLLRYRDLTGEEDVRLTQAFLGQLLGIQRTTVTLMVAMLEADGVVRHTRGRIRILDPAGLARCTCECYAVVKAHTGWLCESASV
jgi:CRP-like cAMP-binding protein